MKFPNILRKYFIVILLFVICFLVAGLIATQLIMRSFAPKDLIGPPLFFVKLVEDKPPNERLAFIKYLRSLDSMTPPLNLLDENGNNLSDPGEKLPGPWSEIAKSAESNRFVELKGKRMLGLPGPPGPRPGIVQLKGEPVQYIYFARNSKRPMPPPSLILMPFAAMTFALILGIGVALFFIYRSIHEKVLLADSVIGRLKSGDLKARFPVGRKDEFGQAMIRFNTMAEEVEHLVEQLRTVEKSRMTLLQELAHDLRTPIASLKNLIATVQKRLAQQEDELSNELLFLSNREIEYFERLVEDLLVLAQVSEPHYKRDSSPIVVAELLDDEAEAVASKYLSADREVWVDKCLDSDCDIHGDSHLLRRLFRNALENAFSFAATTVSIKIDDSHEQLKVEISDDGPGFPEDLLANFGTKRISRVLDRSKSGRVSVGLGSVIMKAIVHLHHGALIAENIKKSDGTIGGSRITIFLPKF